MISTINNISFLGKIKIADTTIKENSSGKSIAASVYEYDGKDKSDPVEFEKRSIEGTAFRLQILDALKQKARSPLTSKKCRIFTVETNDGKIVANTHIEDNEDSAEIIQIGTNKKGYRGAGKKLIGIAGSYVLADKEGNPRLSAFAPVPDAVPFYTVGCHFKYDKNYNLYTDKHNLDIMSQSK